MSVLQARGLAIGFGRTALARDLTLSVEAAEFVCLLGPNGVGKSTLLRTLSAMQPALAGDIELESMPLTNLSPRERAQRMAVMLTERGAAGMLTVRELVELGRQPHTGWNGRLLDVDRSAVDSALRATGCEPLAERHVGDLSDGEQQRAWLARALAQQPRVLLLDEVLAFLDLPRRVTTMHLLRRLARERGIAIVLSCHDLELALRDADTLWLLTPEGELHCGAPQSLVASGALESAFAREGVRFDAASGRFYAEEALPL